MKIHDGGDQLTRERMSGAKRIRSGHDEELQKLSKLTPITFEFFHMLMNLMEVIVKELYNAASVASPGTLCQLKELVSRHSFNADVKKAYDADKQFVLSVTTVYGVAAVLHHFGMASEHDFPQQNCPPENATDDAKKEWLLSC